MKYLIPLLFLSTSLKAQDTIFLNNGDYREVKILSENNTHVTAIFKGKEVYLDKKVIKKIVKSDDVYDNYLFQYNDLGVIEISEVFEINGRNKDQLYSAAKEWFAESFKDSKEVLQYDDKELGKMIGKGHANMDVLAGFGVLATKINFTLKALIKDGKVKLSIYDLSYTLTNATQTNAYNVTLEEYYAKSSKKAYRSDGVQRNHIPKLKEYTASILYGLNTSFNTALSNKSKGEFDF